MPDATFTYPQEAMLHSGLVSCRMGSVGEAAISELLPSPGLGMHLLISKDVGVGGLVCAHLDSIRIEGH